jgi:Cu+-exporting ATPase
MNTEHTISQEQEIRLSILGMRCAGCIAAVETALQ